MSAVFCEKFPKQQRVQKAKGGAGDAAMWPVRTFPKRADASWQCAVRTFGMAVGACEGRAVPAAY